MSTFAALAPIPTSVNRRSKCLEVICLVGKSSALIPALKATGVSPSRSGGSGPGWGNDWLLMIL